MDNLLDNISDKVIIGIGKIVGIHFPESSLSDKNKVMKIIKNREKYNDFMSIVDFMNKSHRNNIIELLQKTKRIIESYIQSLQFYKDINVDDIRNKTADIKDKLKFNKKTAYLLDINDNNKYISVDIQSANFTSLKIISNGQITDTWDEFFRRLVPNDVRTASKRNIEANIVGLTIDIPKCFYESKYVRQYVFGDLKKLRIIWEYENVKYLQKISELNLQNNICVNSDEIVIEVKDYDEADNIKKMVPFNNIHRIKEFQIFKIDGYRKNYMFKQFRDGTKTLVNIDPEYYDEIYEKFIK